MYTYTKEKQFIVAHDSENKFAGKYDLQNNVFYGINHRVVKNRPIAFITKNLETAQYSNTVAYNLCVWLTRNYDKIHAEWLPRFEELTSLNMLVDSASSFINRNGTRDTRVLTKKFLDTYKHFVTKYNISTIKRMLNDGTMGYIYNTYVVEEMITMLPKYDNIEKSNCSDKCKKIARIFCRNHPTYSIAQIGTCIKLYTLMERENVALIEPCASNTISVSPEEIIANWIDWSIDMTGAIREVSRNILSEYCKFAAEYTIWKTANQDVLINKINNNPSLLFENDEFFVHLLPTTKDMVDEGNAQSNCVGRLYVSEVANRHCAIVSIRKKSDPDHSYITCEVTPNGQINQYYLKFNTRIRNDSHEAIFRMEYQRYLDEHYHAND